jgi:hypothetical protein
VRRHACAFRPGTGGELAFSGIARRPRRARGRTRAKRCRPGHPPSTYLQVPNMRPTLGHFVPIPGLFHEKPSIYVKV